MGAPFFGKDALTDKPARFFVTEIIREKILLLYDKEVPYSAEVLVEKFDEKEKAIHIMAVVYVERDSQKAILIGRGGEKIKQVGIAALCLGLGGGGGCLTLHGRYHGVHGFCLPVVERQGLVLGVAQHVGARAGVHGLYLLFAAAAAHILVLCILHCGEV